GAQEYLDPGVDPPARLSSATPSPRAATNRSPVDWRSVRARLLVVALGLRDDSRRGEGLAEAALDGRLAELDEAVVAAGGELGAQTLVVDHPVDHRGPDQGVAVAEEDAGVAEGVGDRSGGQRHDRHLEGHRLQQGHTEPLVL